MSASTRAASKHRDASLSGGVFGSTPPSSRMISSHGIAQNRAADAASSRSVGVGAARAAAESLNASAKNVATCSARAIATSAGAPPPPAPVTAAGARRRSPVDASAARTEDAHASKSPEPRSVIGAVVAPAAPSSSAAANACVVSHPRGPHGYAASALPASAAARTTRSLNLLSRNFAPTPRWLAAYTAARTSSRVAAASPAPAGMATICADPPPTSTAPMVRASNAGTSAPREPTRVRSTPRSAFAASHAKKPSSSPETVRK